jgi:hypothetical protein
MRTNDEVATPPRPSDTQAVIGAAIAIVGVLAAVNPGSQLLKALNVGVMRCAAPTLSLR